jgi:hypothetical protein
MAWKRLLLAAALAACADAQAHHSFTMFDQTRETTLTGVVREFQWTNPHAWIVLDATGADGHGQVWSLEALSPNVLRRLGWKRATLTPGERITVKIYPKRDGSAVGSLLLVNGPDGKRIGRLP